LLSGGVDSSTALYLAIRDFGRENATAYSVDYGQLHRREMEYARKICEHAKVPHRILTLSPQPSSPLTNKEQNLKIPDKTYAELGEGVSPSYHHYRNGQLLSLVAAYASADLHDGEKGVIYAGQHAEDAANWAYADCTFEFLGAQANAIYVGTYHRIRLYTPLVWLQKADVVSLGQKLGVPWELTYSCYKGEERHCGLCPTCRARRQAFIDAGVADPTEYIASLVALEAVQ
jgi:7-cyano-7-deazaguanine synthase